MSCITCNRYADGRAGSPGHCSLWEQVVPEEHLEAGCDQHEPYALVVSRLFSNCKTMEELYLATFQVEAERMTPSDFAGVCEVYDRRVAVFHRRGERNPVFKFEENTGESRQIRNMDRTEDVQDGLSDLQ